MVKNLTHIKKWFLDKNFDYYERQAYNTSFGFTVERETEKAVLIEIDGDYGKVTKWIPKSVLITKEEYETERDAVVDSFENGLEYNEKLLKFAKENNVKGIRKGMRTVTLISKIKDYDLEVPVRN